MKYASFGRRLVANLLDSAIITCGTTIIGLILGFVGGLAGTPLEAISILSSVVGILLGVAYWVGFTGIRGQTPGKIALSIKVIGPGGGPPGIGRALLREVIGKFLSGLALCLGYLWMLWDSKRQCWHDKLADTLVIHTATAQSAQASPGTVSAG